MTQIDDYELIESLCYLTFYTKESNWISILSLRIS